MRDPNGLWLIRETTTSIQEITMRSALNSLGRFVPLPARAEVAVRAKHDERHRRRSTHAISRGSDYRAAMATALAAQILSNADVGGIDGHGTLAIRDLCGVEGKHRTVSAMQIPSQPMPSERITRERCERLQEFSKKCPTRSPSRSSIERSMSVGDRLQRDAEAKGFA